MNYRLGIDVGGTNTDAVLIDENLQVTAELKQATTTDIHDGISAAISALLEKSHIDRRLITKAMLGTTQCTNAIVERKHLSKIGVLRIGAPATTGIRPMLDWVKELKVLAEEIAIIRGGFEYNGKELAAFDEQEARRFFERCKEKGLRSVAISQLFSVVRSDHEIRAAQICREVMGDVHISLSGEIGSMGLIERENATILNAALYKIAHNFTEGFVKSLEEHGIDAEVYFSQNDGTLMSKEQAILYPIFTIACGPTNSIRGAGYLSKLSNALVIDIGGTTTDFGILQNGLPRESSIAVSIGGVRTNFRMPDVISIGLGGGSIIREKDGIITIGPDSVGYRLTEKALVFGGDTLTATDIAVALGLSTIGDPEKVVHIDKAFAAKAMAKIVELIEDHIDLMKTSAEDIDVLLVGGGSILLPDHLNGVKRLYKPDHFSVANAIGSAIAKISGTYEKLVSYDDISRETAIEEGKKEAIDMAIKAGAQKGTVEIIDVEDFPLQYQGNICRIKIKAAGELKKRSRI
ncbi:MAG: hydantoinase/oxoprolinase family protein [Spirochaetaceae bacterium]|jgi:N-methylhydantoinase A/oxoprolinase/acetone carboxylase beta subunit|nr:hydantoinase/oxoprolinase family protein [Spirochaetaceae bacterium]